MNYPYFFEYSNFEYSKVYVKQHLKLIKLLIKTGAKGFEPLNAWTKTRCLTAWRRPINVSFHILTIRYGVLSSIFLEKLLTNFKYFWRVNYSGDVPMA